MKRFFNTYKIGILTGTIIGLLAMIILNIDISNIEKKERLISEKTLQIDELKKEIEEACNGVTQESIKLENEIEELEKQYDMNKPIYEKLIAEEEVAKKLEKERLKAEEEKFKAEEERLKPFRQTFAKMDSIIKTITTLESEFNNSENWYKDTPIFTNEGNSALIRLEDSDTTPLAAILVEREENELAEELAQLSIGINKIKDDLTRAVRLSYYPTENSNWDQDIRNAKSYLSTAKSYVNKYNEIKAKVENN